MRRLQWSVWTWNWATFIRHWCFRERYCVECKFLLPSSLSGDPLGCHLCLCAHFFVSFFLYVPITPLVLSTRHKDCPAKLCILLLLTGTLSFTQSSTSCRFICLHYPVLHVPWKTVSSSKTTCLVSLDKSILYCLNIVAVISVHISSSTSSLRPFPFAVSH